MQFPYQKFEFNIKPQEPLILPSYKGSTLRGGFGNAFKRIVCAIKSKECTDCILKEKCIYSYVFETPPPSDTKIMRKYTSAPHPFIIEPPPEKKRGYTPEDELIFGLTLIGKAIDYLPYFIYTFDELGKMGIGRGRGKYELKEVRSGAEDKVIYSSDTKTLRTFKTDILSFNSVFTNTNTYKPKSLTLNFLTPARIIYKKHLILDLEFHILIRNLLRRLSLLCYFHCGGDTSGWDFKGIIETAQDIKVKKRNLKWYDWERYSSRQETKMKMGGFVGEITFEGNIEPFMPLIKAGEVLHVGKGTGFGLGRYEIK
ncbi:MAG TPA: CRISPR system precrRNA processing endoribonuclease RAMP protein Cas6 [Nitrospirae bacterium]|nr:CRISPR system precrRNA processing endoribonuclease RAMP protein Cas6 [Nitrospirota bacterium]HDY99963.1 CRISPR system precrRNA processing endoribonuclease RAMP protein Cas6 [Nitrospirota bacterium]